MKGEPYISVCYEYDNPEEGKQIVSLDDLSLIAEPRLATHIGDFAALMTRNIRDNVRFQTLNENVKPIFYNVEERYFDYECSKDTEPTESIPYPKNSRDVLVGFIIDPNCTSEIDYSRKKEILNLCILKVEEIYKSGPYVFLKKTDASVISREENQSTFGKSIF